MRRGLVIVLGIVAVVAVIYLAMSAVLPHKGAVAPTIEPPPAPTAQIVYVLVAAKDIRRGQMVQASDVAIMGWPITDEIMPPLGSLLADAPDSEAGLDQVIGRIARTDIVKNQPVLDFMLTPSANNGPDALAPITPSP